MYIFIVDTDKYAGNFEREMTAYMTGQSGDCGIGADIAIQFESLSNLPNSYFEDLVKNVSNEDGFYSPCKIWETEGWFNDGLGNHYRDSDEEIAKKNYRTECLKRAKKEKEKNSRCGLSSPLPASVERGNERERLRV